LFINLTKCFSFCAWTSVYTRWFGPPFDSSWICSCKLPPFKTPGYASDSVSAYQI